MERFDIVICESNNLFSHAQVSSPRARNPNEDSRRRRKRTVGSAYVADGTRIDGVYAKQHTELLRRYEVPVMSNAF